MGLSPRVYSPQSGDGLMQAAATWPILMEKIAGKKYEVYFGITSDLEYLRKVLMAS